MESIRVLETQFQSSQLENFQFRDAQNVESNSSNDHPTPERNEKETSEELQPVTEKNYPPGFSLQQQQLFSVEDSPPHRKRKRKKATSASSTENEMFDLVKQIAGIKAATETEVEQRQQYREQKLRILEANEERKAQLLDREIENQHMKYFLRPHDHLTGGLLRTVLLKGNDKLQLSMGGSWRTREVQNAGII
ncbi:unnamed protein product [Lactuca virosa]|uniref:No apical meristem-associated C-terminal domain-containing protein n=1 Tax=Lactuca virosa TaxID=75947 RepID=A0AAU9MMP9_9ASTR|nr:unnamed protein product [Lactuca virosa]